MTKMIGEALENRRFQPGQVKFAASQWTDPHIQHVLNAIAVASGKTPQEIIKIVQGKVDELASIGQHAPTLYKTMTQNSVESELFNILWKMVDVPTNAPKFSRVVFLKLVRAISSENDEFWPLRSFIDKRRLNPKYDFVAKDHQIGTAAATPTGTFYFNEHFCQKLLDYAHLKQLKPKGLKYVSNGGDIPDEYAYIEFLIMHEFMHYSNDDFHYQRVIPKSNPKIINWVGDFRSNYLLVKSGYEQLPIGLYADDINYDRQKTYVEMYNLVKSEMEKLPKGDQEKATGKMDELSDDHEPGQAEGAESDATEGKDVQPGDIDKNGKTIEDQMKKGKDQTPSERAPPKQDGPPGQGEGQGGPGAGKNGDGHAVDYSNIRPTFSWTAIVKRFLATAARKTEETYAKPARRGVSGLEIVRQVGAAAIKPAEKQMDNAEAKLAFCFDSSGSMGGVIGKIFANAVALLKQPMFKNSEVLVLKYSGSHDIFRANFARNKAAQVPDTKVKPKQYPMTAQDIFTKHIGGGTNFSAALATDLKTAIANKWNVLIFIDGDNLVGQNFVHLCSVIKAKPAQVFIIFDARSTYLDFRRLFGGATPNITYFE